MDESLNFYPGSVAPHLRAQNALARAADQVFRIFSCHTVYDWQGAQILICFDELTISLRVNSSHGSRNRSTCGVKHTFVQLAPGRRQLVPSSWPGGSTGNRASDP